MSSTATEIAHVPDAPGATPGTSSTPAQRKRRHESLPPGTDSQPALPLTNQQKKQTKKQRKQANKREKEAREANRLDALGNRVRWVAKPPNQIKQRMARALPGSSHRLNLIERKPLPNYGGEEFTVLGATGNVYQVAIPYSPSNSTTPTCSCPDALKGEVCKHRLFVMLRVLGLDTNDPLAWQRVLLPDEVQRVLSSSGGVPSDVQACPDVVNQWRRLSGQGTSAEAGMEGRRPIHAGDECPICQNELREGASAPEEKATFCASCGCNIHSLCINKWVDVRDQKGLEASCPVCRTQWVDGLNPKLDTRGQYVNLAAFSAAHRAADTSRRALYGESSRWGWDSGFEGDSDFEGSDFFV